MKRRAFVSLLGAFTVIPLAALAQGGPGPGPGARRWSRERLYGSPLMTLEERQAHQRKMWEAKTPEERQKIRDEHRKLMTERAKQRNYTIDPKEDDVFSVPSASG
jgi:hypothetical protein